MKPIILVGLVLLLSACAPSKTEYPVKPLDAAQMDVLIGPKPITTSDADTRIDALKAAIATLEKDKRDIIVAARQSKLHWLSGILGFVAVALGVAAWFSPFFRVTLIEAAAGCAAFATILLFVARWAAYFEWIGAGFLVATAVTVVLLWRNKAHALQVLATHFTSYADKLGDIAPEVRARLDRISVEAQAATPAVKATIDKALATVNPETKL